MINPTGTLSSCHGHGRIFAVKGWTRLHVDKDNTET